ncbi:hypothetical protein JZ751_027496 [Albula glossodonta]|uniref:NADH dehydrogenase [ubiquinone] 1 beta subcomplex subunit 7 n=1 Tax=Albula glossodonta TaxID=121402 RepID=A0A8T2NBV0_9TELE|nr:hypothetical protein JZ751_027496 [Albula glossodonta]
MGAHLVKSYVTNTDTEPDPKKPPAFDPMLGFDERKERGPGLAWPGPAQVNKTGGNVRDYCAHHLLKLMKCKRDNWPNFLACKHERHDWDYCQHHDYIMRMKEFERERRLLMRKKRIEEAQAA